MQITSGVVVTDGVVLNTTYYDPNVLYGFANNQIGITYGPLVTLASSSNNQIGITYGPLVTLASSTNNQISINTRGA